MATLAHQETHRLRQLPQDQRQQQQRHGGSEEHRLPAEARQHVDTHAGGEHAAQRVAAEHHRHQGAAQALGRVLVHQRHGVGHQPATAQACDKAEDAELGRVAGEAIEDGRRGEQHEADGDALLAPDPVGQGAEAEGAEHHAEQRVAAQSAGFQRGQAPLLHDRRQHHAEDEQVVAVEDQQQRAERHDHPVEAGKACVVDNGVNVYLSHGIGSRFCFCCERFGWCL